MICLDGSPQILITLKKACNVNKGILVYSFLDRCQKGGVKTTNRLVIVQFCVVIFI